MGSLVNKISEAIFGSPKSEEEIYKVEVNYDLTLPEMITAGKYDWVSEDINFLCNQLWATGWYEVELVIVHLKPNTTKTKLQKYLARHSLEAARLEHLLAFGAAFPDVLLKIPIACLGSGSVPQDAYIGYPYLSSHGGERRLGLYWHDAYDIWSGPVLAVCNSSPLLKKVGEISATYKIVVDYTKPLSEIISAGKFKWFHDDINDKNFQFQGTNQHEVELVLVRLNRYATTKEVLEYMHSQGLEPAKVEHLLAFGIFYPNVQLEFSIIALGSTCSWDDGSGYRYPTLNCGDHIHRRLDLFSDPDGEQWMRILSNRFLAVRR